MRVLFLSGNMCDGGAQRVISVVASRLAERGHDVGVLLFSRNEKEYPLYQTITILSVASNFEEYTKIPHIKRIRMVRSLINQFKPDVAVGFLEGGYALYLSAIGLSFPKIASARIDPERLAKAKGFRAMINRMWFKHAVAVVLQNNAQMEKAKTYGWHDCVVIPNPISPVALSADNYEYREKCKTLIMAGRLSNQKNYDLIIEAVNRLLPENKDIRLIIYGKGEEEVRLKRIIHDKKLETVIDLRGWTQNLLNDLTEGDIYVLSSNFEGMPNALMEAMAVGLPCISTDCPTGPGDLIENGETGYLVPVNDVESMSRAIKNLLELDADDRKRIGLKAKRYIAQNYNEDAVAVRWEALFNSLVNKKK